MDVSRDPVDTLQDSDQLRQPVAQSGACNDGKRGESKTIAKIAFDFDHRFLIK
jgi:hypothetical protein